MNSMQQLAQMVESSKHIVAFTGAGVSTESNIPDFRSSGGVYDSIRRAYGRAPEVLLSHEFFVLHPEIFFDYLRKYLVFPDALPNMAHKTLAALERAGRLECVITQNIDGLHQKAGSREVCELHGSIYRNYCIGCGRKYDLQYTLAADGVPLCGGCGGIVRPDVVLYSERLDTDVLERAARAIKGADLLLVMGTSLAVYPASGLLNYFRGNNIVLINKSPTPFDGKAGLVISGEAGKAMGGLAQLIGLNVL
jgi:NAD-dependent deacetylase